MFLASLRVRLLFLVVLATLPALGLILYTAAEGRRDAIVELQETALGLARLAATDQGRRITSARELLVALAEFPGVRRQDVALCAESFRRVLEKYPIFLNLGATKADGDLFCSALPIAEPTNLADRAYFRRAVAARDFAVGDYQVGRVTRKASVNVAYPVFAGNGQIQGVVFVAIDLAGLNQVIRAARLPERSTLTVVDRAGTVLVRHPDPERWVGTSLPDAADVAVVRTQQSGVAEAAGLDGVSRLIGFTPLLDGDRGGDVYVSIGIPKDAAVAGANRALTRNLAALGIVGALALVAAWYGGDAFVLRKVNRLVEATRRLAAGDVGVRIGRPYAGELGQLAKAFDEMADAIRAREEEVRRSHHALAQNEKLAALGRLAAGVAHELRNPLTVIDGRLQILHLQMSRGTPPALDSLSGFVARAGEATERMKSIMRGLSNYSKPERSEPTILDAGELLSAAAELVSYAARSGGVRIALDVPPRTPPVLGERSEMMQILVNLATNAVEAMVQTGGTLTLGVRADDGEGRPRVVIEVTDTGPGISTEQLERIWEPFYTTKAEGTGLGLSIVRGLAEKQPGASLAVESAIGVGTTFRLTMPVAVTPLDPE